MPSKKPPASKRPLSKTVELIEATPFRQQRGKEVYNASEVVAVADSRFLFCDNNVSDSLFEMRLRKNGMLDGALVRHKISGVCPVYFDDFESMAVARDQGNYIIVVATSFSLQIRDAKAKRKRDRGKRSIERESLLRIIHAESQQPQAEIIPGFRSWLIGQAPDLGRQWRKSWQRIPDDNGLNLEGMAWHPDAKELLFGLRTPVIDGKAVILRVRVKNIAGTWNLNNFDMQPPVFLDLGESKEARGIRTMEYDPARRTMWVVTGNATSDSKAPFELWEWDGNPHGKVRGHKSVRFHKKFRVEGVSPGTVGGRSALVFVDDRGGYGVLWEDDPRLR